MKIKMAKSFTIALLLTGTGSFPALPSLAASVGDLDDPGLNLFVVAEHSTRAVKADDSEVTLGTFSNTRLYGPNTVEQVSMELSEGEETVDRIYLRTAYGFQRFGVFGKVGIAKHQTGLFSVTGSSKVEDTAFFGSGTEIFEMGNLGGRGEYGLVWGGGAQAYLQQGNFRMGLKAEYLFHQLDAGYPLSETGVVTVDPVGQTVSSILTVSVDETKTQEIQAALVLSVTLSSLTSYYGGLKFSMTHTEYIGTTSRIERDDAAVPRVLVHRDRFRFKTASDEFVSLFVGAAYRVTTHIGLNAEIRAGDEAGLTAQMEYHF